MSQYSTVISGYRQQYESAKKLEETIKDMTSKLGDMYDKYSVMLEAQSLLATVSDTNANNVLDYITGVINKALAELFPYDVRRIYLEKTLYRGQYAHINVKLITSDGKERNMKLQSGNGLRQVISFLFVVSLIEIRKGRRILIMDELLNGLHPEAKRIVFDIVQIFAEEGFQFVVVEYGVNDVGKLYIVEKPDKIASVTPLGSEDKYNDEIFLYCRPKEDVDMSITVDEGEE